MIPAHTDCLLSVCGKLVDCPFDDRHFAGYKYTFYIAAYDQTKQSLPLSKHSFGHCSKCKRYTEALAAYNKALDLAKHGGYSIAVQDDMQVNPLRS